MYLIDVPVLKNSSETLTTYVFCTQFFIPVPLEDGWVVLMWDMMSRKPHILDLMIRGDGPTEPTKDKLELIAWKLHHALFHCLNEYYAGWLAYARRRVGGPLRTCCNETFVRFVIATQYSSAISKHLFYQTFY